MWTRNPSVCRPPYKTSRKTIAYFILLFTFFCSSTNLFVLACASHFISWSCMNIFQNRVILISSPLGDLVRELAIFSFIQKMKVFVWTFPQHIEFNRPWQKQGLVMGMVSVQSVIAEVLMERYALSEPAGRGRPSCSGLFSTHTGSLLPKNQSL